VAKTPETEPDTSGSAPHSADAGKGRATPTRKEREAANKRPLVPNDRKEAARASRGQVAEARERARIGMANGEERYLPVRDKGPQRKYVRDYVDARFSLGEALLPLVVLVLAATFLPPAIADYALLFVWLVFLAVAIDCIILGFLLNRKLTAKFGAGRVDRGFRWYAAMRAVQLRPMRLPKPQVKRFQFPS
jgi:hypothetical protein